MKTPKQLFIEKKELAARLRDVVSSTWFAECLTYARAEMLGVTGSVDEMRGATKFEEILRSLPDEEPETPPDDSGLEHELDNPGRKRGKRREK